MNDILQNKIKPPIPPSPDSPLPLFTTNEIKTGKKKEYMLNFLKHHCY